MKPSTPPRAQLWEIKSSLDEKTSELSGSMIRIPMIPAHIA